MRIVIFGGTGFVGAHYARHLLESHPDAQVVLCDVEPLLEERFSSSLVEALRSPRCKFVRHDVRSVVPSGIVDGRVDLIANFAAVHREPGFQDSEYWETNVPGAENVVRFARETSCQTIIFSSSISPYGISELTRDERSLPMPSTPYGCSKLVAEGVHKLWQAESPGRRLLIVRPGVIFGAGEGGNVSRMIRFLRRGLFLYVGNHGVRKAGIFVKELCRMFDWGLEHLGEPEFCNIRPGAAFFNASFDPPPSVEDYVMAIKEVGGFDRPTVSVPYRLVYLASFLFLGLAGIHPVRVRKLVRPNLILPSFLLEKDYPWRWNLKRSLEDWKAEKPEDWGLPAGSYQAAATPRVHLNPVYRVESPVAQPAEAVSSLPGKNSQPARHP